MLLHNPVTSYRWLLDGGDLGRCWVNGAGTFHRDVTDDADFRLSAWSPEPGPPGTTAGSTPPPEWLAGTVGYQIFIDRFANSGVARPTPDWAIPRAWDEPVEDTPGIRARHWYGGDLAGVEANLDHLVHLGVSLIYLTPFFPAGSMHRYDASTFDHVDPALGGDDALASLVSAAHERGIRVIGDITLNHTGAHHDWFEAASADPDAVERGFYFFDDAEPFGYVAWHGVRSLPKLDHRGAALRERFYDGDRSVVAHYLKCAVRARRLARRLCEHHRTVRCERRQPRGRPHRSRDLGLDTATTGGGSSPSTATTPATTSTARVGTA